MTTTYRLACPDCGEPVERRRRRSADARCDPCRAEVGHKRQRTIARVRDLGPGVVPQ